MTTTDKPLRMCPSCRGTKRIRGMGMIEHNCHNCNGIGWVEIEANTPIAEIDTPIVTIKKKPGRKKQPELQV